jgi:hypothetical protein
MIEDCDTAETLYIGEFSQILSLQSGGEERKTLRAVAPFDGAVIVANIGHRASARDFNIVVGPGVEAGCDSGIHAALSFVLDGASEEDRGSPDPSEFDPAYRHTNWRISSVHISSQPLEPLCNGIEAMRLPNYDRWDGAYEGRIYVVDNWIKYESYENVGILFDGFKAKSDAHRPPEVIRNRVDTPAQSDYDPVGIYFGGISSSEPSNPSAALIEGNVISMSGSDIGIEAYSDIGIEAYGAVGTEKESVLRINKNIITGARTGILVDSQVADVNLSGNTLTGDGVDESGDVGIDSDAQCTRTKGKPNNIAGYDVDIDDSGSGCP